MDPAVASQAWVAGASGVAWDGGLSGWSDAPPGQGSPAGLEPSSKKATNDLQVVQSYGMNYGMQQTPTYGLNLPDGSQHYGSQHLPAQYPHAPFAPGSAKASGAMFYKTKLCNNFKSGACTFNERCIFAHGVEDLRKPASGLEGMVPATGSMTATTRGNLGAPAMGGHQKKNRLCRYFVDGNCPYGDRCNFLHGNEEIVKTTAWDSSVGVRGPTASKTTYKTRLCANWEKGEPCSFGDKCHFAHGPDELQKYSGVSGYPNGGTATSDMQYPSSTPEMGAPNLHTAPGMMNPPPSAVSYGVPENYARSGGRGPDATSNMNPYASNNGASANYNYWEGSAAPRQPTVSGQAYVQASQAPWMVEYSAMGGYPRRENDTTVSQYAQEQPYPQGPPFVTGGNVYEYQDPTQYVNSIYAHGHSQNMYQGEARNSGVGHYNGAYSEATYTNQQEDYNTRYEMAEAWGVNK